MGDIKDEELYLNLYGNTWENNVSNLYDYHSKEKKEFKTLIHDKTIIKRKGEEILEKSQNLENNECIFDIKKLNNEKYIFENDIEINMEQNQENISKINNKLWYVVNKNQKYYITKNEVIKLGRIKYIITEESIYSGDIKYDLSIPNENISNINNQNSKKGNPFNLIKNIPVLDNNIQQNENKEEKVLCKICYMEETDSYNNPMVHLCKCKGGLNYAHFNCIKLWMKANLNFTENRKKTVQTYFIPKFNCEICKVPYPIKFTLNKNGNKIYELIDIKRPNNNYIILESLEHLKENLDNNKYIHVINLINKEDLIIGRSSDSDIKINDISVSRRHARLNFDFDNKSLLITDLNSKFGTLILIKDKFDLKNGETLFIQSGRTLFKIEAIKNKINEDKNNICEEQKINENEIMENNNSENEMKEEINKEKNVNDINENNMEIS